MAPSSSASLNSNPAAIRIGIIGLGYVGLPLAVEFARKYPVVGFDIKQSRIDELNRGEDYTREVDPADLRAGGNGWKWGTDHGFPVYEAINPLALR